MSKPKPVPESLVCSECGLDWSLHPDNPRRRDCIELLKKNQVSVAVLWNNSSNWGHLNCWQYHTSPAQYTYINTTGFTYDDPDIGTPAIVS